MRILLGVNVLDSVKAAVYNSHIALVAQAKRDIPDLTWVLYTPQRTAIDTMRNEAARLALMYECDYLLFVDDDVIVEPETVGSLLKADKDIVMAETYVRGMPFNEMFFKNTPEGGLRHYDNFEGEVDPNGLLSCDAVGFSCCLIKCEVLKKISTPYFVTIPGRCTEDIYFCVKARQELGEGVSIYVDTKVPTAHTLTDQYIHKANAKLWRIFGKLQQEAVFTETHFRGEVYEAAVMKAFEGAKEEALCET